MTTILTTADVAREATIRRLQNEIRLEQALENDGELRRLFGLLASKVEERSSEVIAEVLGDAQPGSAQVTHHARAAAFRGVSA